ncbi:MAG: D-glycerate dehydrogenase [Desulfobacteraceae bacterium]|jgi:glyoxylate reductase
MKVLVTGNMPGDVAAPLVGKYDVTMHPEDNPMARDAILSSIHGVHGLLCMITDVIDERLFEIAPELKIVANFGVGFDNIDVKAATDRGIMVTNTPGVLTDATADITMALILAVGRRVVEGDQYTRRGKFRFWAPFHFLGHEITGKTLGIVGMGRIGAAVARRAAGFNMSVVYHNRRRLSEQEEASLGAGYVDFKTLLQQSDFVSIHVPLNSETRHLIGSRELAAMRSGAFLINTARGPVVDEKALFKALEKRQICGAGLDVYEDEPDLTPGLETLDNVVLLPHMGSATHQTRRRMGAMAVENLMAGLAGRLPPNCLNPEVL